MVRGVIARVVYEQVRVGKTIIDVELKDTFAEMLIAGWERVGRSRRHRPGAMAYTLRATQWRGEQMAVLYVSERHEPLACEFCDRLIAPGEADPRWSRCHRACVVKARTLIAERRADGGVGSPRRWGLTAIEVRERPEGYVAPPQPPSVADDLTALGKLLKNS